VLDVLICTNLVNYAVVVHGVRPGRERPALILYEPWRFAARAMPRVAHRSIGIWTLRALRLLVALRLVHTLYLPHDRFNWRVGWCRDHARHVAYLDDGLDTHRRVPVNFSLDRTRPAPYYTFDEFVDLPPWLDPFEVRRAGSVAVLAEIAGRPPLVFEHETHVFVESPGLDVTGLIASLAIPDGHVLVVRHPVPAKRAGLSASCREVEGNTCSIEATLLSTRGVHWYFGETMALVFALSAASQRGHHVFAQLRPAQRDNLIGLPLRQVGPPAMGLYTSAE
jgi:hypothetical protein